VDYDAFHNFKTAFPSINVKSGEIWAIRMGLAKALNEYNQKDLKFFISGLE